LTNSDFVLDPFGTVAVDEPFFDICFMIHLRDWLSPRATSSATRKVLSSDGRQPLTYAISAGGEAIAFSWLPCLAFSAFRRFGSLAAPLLGFLDTDDSATAKLHGTRRQSGLLQLIEVGDANADGAAEFPD
jgi:hypothetical protein